ncbi:DUF4402 domain-containing protein [Massilia yuzhufengensis]|uniref:DUF4402 domain-containing protein n=1 Tax=Massilia yuzhufengensis TaxID=1164594 RepID=A0A1I1V3E7_9BURK|nr:DUF4402 domain-containing protein [Massilia yuzhufengensis]SFD77572.1 protein of unknown function [Massilia yuzhufengensis]
MTKHARFTSHLPLAALALALAAATGSAAAAVATASSSSTVVTPIAITKATDLSFGSFAAGAGAGSVTVSTSSARTQVGVVLMGGTITAAKFDVTGQSGLNYSIVLGGSTELTSGTDTMAFATVSDLTGAGAVTGNVSSGTLGAGGQSIYVGGILTVGANQAAGSYTGNVSATVVYE